MIAVSRNPNVSSFRGQSAQKEKVDMSCALES
jgi:hypothetical protein